MKLTRPIERSSVNRRKNAENEASASSFGDTLDKLLDKRIDEAELDFSDVQVRSVMRTMFELIDARNEARREFAKVVLRMMRGKTSMQQVDAIATKLDDSTGRLVGLLEARLWNMGIEFDDEKVIAAMTVAKEVLTYIREHEFDDWCPTFDTASAQNNT
jgi:hypothetical protein